MVWSDEGLRRYRRYFMGAEPGNGLWNGNYIPENIFRTNGITWGRDPNYWLTPDFISISDDAYYLIYGAETSGSIRTRFYNEAKGYIGTSDVGGIAPQFGIAFRPPAGARYMRINPQYTHAFHPENVIIVGLGNATNRELTAAIQEQRDSMLERINNISETDLNDSLEISDLINNIMEDKNDITGIHGNDCR